MCVALVPSSLVRFSNNLAPFRFYADAKLISPSLAIKFYVSKRDNILRHSIIAHLKHGKLFFSAA